VLFALYPTVMVLSFLNPLWRNLSFAESMLIGNILSVGLLTYLVMPRVSQFLNFWLTAPRATGKTRRSEYPLSLSAWSCSFSYSRCCDRLPDILVEDRLFSLYESTCANPNFACRSCSPVHWLSILAISIRANAKADPTCPTT